MMRVVAGIAALCCLSVDAMPSFLKLIPGSQNVPGVEAIGHTYTGGGGGLNGFGQAFLNNQKAWSVELCYKDSDGDGQFNGAELGDPCCEWVQKENEKLAYTTATAPGDKTSKQDPKIWAGITCANGQDPVAKYVANGGSNSTTTDDVETPVPSSPVSSPPSTPSPSPSGVSAVSVSVSVALSVVALATAMM